MLLRGKLRHLSLGHDLIQAEGLNKAPDEEFGDGFAAIVLANLIKNIGCQAAIGAANPVPAFRDQVGGIHRRASRVAFALYFPHFKGKTLSLTPASGKL